MSDLLYLSGEPGDDESAEPDGDGAAAGEGQELLEYSGGAEENEREDDEFSEYDGYNEFGEHGDDAENGDEFLRGDDGSLADEVDFPEAEYAGGGFGPEGYGPGDDGDIAE